MGCHPVIITYVIEDFDYMFSAKILSKPYLNAYPQCCKWAPHCMATVKLAATTTQLLTEDRLVLARCPILFAKPSAQSTMLVCQ